MEGRGEERRTVWEERKRVRKERRVAVKEIKKREERIS